MFAFKNDNRMITTLCNATKIVGISIEYFEWFSIVSKTHCVVGDGVVSG